MSATTLGGWLVHVMQRADGALSLEEALHVIMDSMKDYFPCQSVAVILIDDDTKEMRIKISRQISYTFVKKYHMNGPSPTAEKVVLEQQPLLLNNITPDSETYRELKLEHDFTSAVLAPVVRNQRGVGYIFADRTNGDKFNQSDLLHLQVIGFLIGNIMEKFDLIQLSRKLSQLDDSTQVLQYKAFIPEMTTELQRARTHDYQVTLALVSVCAFREYVETYGIDGAHALLAEVAGIIKENIRDMDIIGRFGADEFIVCLSGMNREEAQQRLDEIRQIVAEKAVGQGDTAIYLRIGALTLEHDKDLTTGTQEILGALGRSLVEAKSSHDDSSGAVVHSLSEN